MNKIIIIYNIHSIINFIFTNIYKVKKIYYNKINYRIKKIFFYLKYSNIKIKKKNLLKIKNIKKNILLLIKINFKINLYKINNLLKIKKNKKIVMLDNISDINNIGSILRTSNFFNIDAIIYISKKISNNFINSKIFQISSGSITPILIKKDIIKFINFLKKKGFLIISLKEDSKISFIKLSLNKNYLLIIGSEYNSYKNKKIIDKSNYIISIPNNGGLKELNNSVAYSMFLYFFMN